MLFLLFTLFLLTPDSAAAPPFHLREAVQSDQITFIFGTLPADFNTSSFAIQLAQGLNTTSARFTNFVLLPNTTSVGFTVLGTASDATSQDVISVLRARVADTSLRVLFPDLVAVTVGNDTLYFPVTSVSTSSSPLSTDIIIIIVVIAAVLVFAAAFVIIKVCRDMREKPKEFELPPLPTFDVAGTTRVVHITPNATAAEVKDQVDEWWSGKTEAKPRVYV